MPDTKNTSVRSMKKVTAIIQARMGSTRLPGKSLKKIGSKTLIERVIDRTISTKHISTTILATTFLGEDTPLANFVSAKYSNVNIFRGHPTDVLDRYYQAAIQDKADVIVRITADDPFKDPDVIDQVIKTFLQNNCDYASNTIEHTFPEGIDIEVCSLAALKKAHVEGKDPLDREHVTYYIWNNPAKFKLRNITSPVDYSSYRLTVDYPKDLTLAAKIYNHFEPRINFSYLEIIDFLKNNPELIKINSHIEKYQSISNNKKQ